MIGVTVADMAAMQHAIDEALEAGRAGDIPIGAVVLNRDGEIIAAAHNEREAANDPTAHAEVLALRRAGEVLGDWRLDECTLVVTLEPCPMCAGAAVMSRVERVLFGAWNEEYGAAGSRWDLIRDRRLARNTEVIGGVLGDECGAMVRAFLEEQRPAREA